MTTTITNAALYARVSTDNNGQDVRNQTDAIKAQAAREGVKIVAEYIDHETGTGKRRRESFERMLNDCEHGASKKFQIIYIWAIDRLSREGTLKTLLILERLASCGIKVRSLQEPWLDPSSPTYDLLLPIFAWIARQESLRISSRIKESLRRLKMDGRQLGRPRIEVNVERVKQVYSDTRSLRITAKMLGLSRALVHRTLKRTCIPLSVAV